MTLAARTFLTQWVVSLLAVGIVAVCARSWLFSFALGLITMLFAYASVLVVMWVLERFRGPAKRMVRWYYIGQGMKYVVLVVLVVLYLHTLSVIGLPFLLGIMVVQLSAAVAGIRRNRDKRRVT